MAIHGPSIPAPTAHPRFVRGGNAPARVLTEAEVIALVDVNPPVAPLPSLTAAFAIRREIFGAVPMTDDGKVRALELHDVVPAGHIAVPITNARWSPHPKQGEFRHHRRVRHGAADRRALQANDQHQEGTQRPKLLAS